GHRRLRKRRSSLGSHLRDPRADERLLRAVPRGRWASRRRLLRGGRNGHPHRQRCRARDHDRGRTRFGAARVEGPSMKRLVLSTAAAAIAVCLTRDAAAFEFGTPPRQHPYRSGQDFALELRFSPYRPQVDDEPGLKGKPFEQAFGDNPRLYVGLELDWQV